MITDIKKESFIKTFFETFGDMKKFIHAKVIEIETIVEKNKAYTVNPRWLEDLINDENTDEDDETRLAEFSFKDGIVYLSFVSESYTFDYEYPVEYFYITNLEERILEDHNKYMIEKEKKKILPRNIICNCGEKQHFTCTHVLIEKIFNSGKCSRCKKEFKGNATIEE